jgi:hypothetical protein
MEYINRLAIPPANAIIDIPKKNTAAASTTYSFECCKKNISDTDIKIDNAKAEAVLKTRPEKNGVPDKQFDCRIQFNPA